MILNPAQVVKGAMERVPWPVSLSISGLAFTLFFLQTGLDMHRVGTASSGAAVRGAPTRSAFRERTGKSDS